MLKSRNAHLSLVTIIPLLILSCWGDSSLTSDKAKVFKVSGIVTDKSGIGIGDVTIEISGTNFSLSDTTSSDGAFLFENVKSGNYKVKPQKDICFFKPASTEIKITDSAIDTMNFTTAENYIHGRILDIVTFKGIKGAKVRIRKWVNLIVYPSIETVTDSDGEFGFYDLEKSRYSYSYVSRYYISGDSGNYTIEETAFTNNEIILRDFYYSSENLPITKAEFNKETNTLSLEWKPSESEYVTGYFVRILKNPDDLEMKELWEYHQIGGYYVPDNNKNSRKITWNEAGHLFDTNIMSAEVYLGISTVYKIGTYSYYGPCSDTIKFRLYW